MTHSAPWRPYTKCFRNAAVKTPHVYWSRDLCRVSVNRPRYTLPSVPVVCWFPSTGSLACHFSEALPRVTTPVYYRSRQIELDRGLLAGTIMTVTREWPALDESYSTDRKTFGSAAVVTIAAPGNEILARTERQGVGGGGGAGVQLIKAT